MAASEDDVQACAAEASAAVGLAAPEETPVVGPTAPESIDGEDLEELSMPLAQK